MSCLAKTVPTEEIAPHLQEAVLYHEYFQDEFVTPLIEDRFLFFFQNIRTYYPSLAAEILAVLELGYWEAYGLRNYLEVDLPTFQDAIEELQTRYKKGIDQFRAPESVILAPRVLQAWHENFAWNAPFDLEANVLVADDIDDEAFADLIANFIWDNRDQLSIYETRTDMIDETLKEWHSKPRKIVHNRALPKSYYEAITEENYAQN